MQISTGFEDQFNLHIVENLMLSQRCVPIRVFIANVCTLNGQNKIKSSFLASVEDVCIELSLYCTRCCNRCIFWLNCVLFVNLEGIILFQHYPKLLYFKSC